MTKEAQRWQDGITAAETVLAGAELVTVVGDREADIYQSWARPRPANLHLLARAAQNRSLRDGDSLFPACDRLPVADRYELEVPRQPGRPARRAQIELRFGQVELMCPHWLRQRRTPLPESVAVHVVDVRECGPRSGPEPPLHWRLLTTHVVNTAAEARQIVEWYRQRWNIEQLFWTLKRQGLDVEASQVETADGLSKLAFLATLAATRIMQLVHARDGATPIPAEEVFTADEVEASASRSPSSKGVPPSRRTLMPAVPWLGQAGSFLALAAGKGTPRKVLPGPSPCATGSPGSKPSAMPVPPSVMCIGEPPLGEREE